MAEETSLRSRILAAIHGRIENRADVLAFWEAGSTATGLADQWSDLDLQVLVLDGAVEAVREAVEQALLSISPIELVHVLPQPAWHGHWQAFYKLAATDPYLLIDLVIMQESNPNRFLEPEIHGHPRVYFDKAGLIRPAPTDSAAFADRLAQRLIQLELPVELMHAFVDKELLRGRPLDAFAFYQGILLNRLVEALRMRHTPWRYNFGLRYLFRDLPPELYQEAQHLLYVPGPAELPGRKERALALFRQTLSELKSLDLVQLLEQTRDR